MDNLQWFKFSPSDWMMGRVQRQAPQVQIDFLRVCCKYWQKSCELSIEDAKLEAMDSYEPLVKNKLIKELNEAISISFLDEQMGGVNSKREQASEAGRRSAEARKRKAESNDRSTLVEKRSTTDGTPLNEIQQRREEKSENRVEKKSKVVGIPPPPQLENVLAYFKENGYSEASAKKAFNYYQTSVTETKKHWSDGKGNPIKNWKMKMQSVWFKDENKEVVTPTKEDRNNQRGNIRFASPIL